MSIKRKQLNGRQYLIITGRIDQDQIPQMEKQLTSLLADGFHTIVVDLTAATYINSGGLRCLVSAWRKARQQEGDLILCGLNERLQEIFSMIGFDKVFSIDPDCNHPRS